VILNKVPPETLNRDRRMIACKEINLDSLGAGKNITRLDAACQICLSRITGMDANIMTHWRTKMNEQNSKTSTVSESARQTLTG
jgi:hypothetical protein